MSYEEFVAKEYYQKLHANGKMTMALYETLGLWINQHKKNKLQQMIDEEVNKLKVEF